MLDFRIHTFLSVCRHMNFTKAAEELHITQPAVSQHIHYLESLYGTQLFLHEGKKVKLSAAGKLLLKTACTLKNDECFMMKQMHEAKPGQLPLKFGVTMTIGEFVLAAPLAAYLKRHPNTDVKIVFANTAELLENLRAGEIHFALVEGYFESDGYDSLVYHTDDFIPVCAKDHAFLHAADSVPDLLGERLLVREPGSGTRDILEKNLAVKNIKIGDFAHTAEVGNMHTIIQLLKEDCGITFLYRTAVRSELASGSLKEIRLTDFHMKHDFTFIWSRGSIFAEEYRRICMDLTQAGSW